MGIFDLFNKKNVELTEEELKWNKMWGLWTEGNAETPYAELMTYQAEINNGGHSQYFFNTENVSDLQKEMSELEHILPAVLKDNLLKAYKAHLAFDEDEEEAEEIMDKCDDVFYENEQEINRILEEYSEKIEV